MADSRTVETIFTVADKATRPLMAINKAMSGAAGLAQRGASAVYGFATSWTGLLGGIGILALLKKGMMELNAQAESNTIAIAGMIQAGGVVAKWEDAMGATDAVMAQLKAHAAALPGEYEDFLGIFQTALPKALEAGFDLSAVEKFTSNFGAVAIALGTDAAQAGRDLQLMLSGRAGAHVAMWTKLQSHIGKTAEQFNQLTIKERAALIQGVVGGDKIKGKFDDMISAYGSTWDSISSTTSMNMKEILRISTQPLFEAAKGELADLNKKFSDNQAKIEMIARITGKVLVLGINTAVSAAKRFGDVLQDIAEAPWVQAIAGGLSKVGGMAMGAAGIAMQEGGAGGIAGLAVGAALPGGSLLTGAVMEFIKHTEAVSSVMDSAAGIVGNLLTAIAPLLGVTVMVSETMGQLAVIILPPLMAAVYQVTSALLYAWEIVIGAFQMLWEAIGPIVSSLVEHIMGVVTTIGRVLTPAIEIAGRLLGWLVESVITPYLIPAFQFLVDYAINPVIDAMKFLLDALADLLEWINESTGKGAADAISALTSKFGIGPAKAAGIPSPSDAIGGFFDKLVKEDAAAQAAKSASKAAGKPTPGVRPTAGTVNDFRGSKFDILQKFEEGFDPDRIAVAFTQDLMKVGERKIQSNAAPAFGVR